MRSPWRITEDQAAEREAEAGRQLLNIYQSCIVPGMPLDAIRAKLAARGVDGRANRLLLALIQRELLLKGVPS